MAKKLVTLNDLRTKYKGAGIWTLYSDETVRSAVANAETVRLVPGVSRVGWFNRPFYIEKGDYKTAENLYGSRDKSLERKGSFFHKSLEVSLAAGPVLALNLMKFNNNLDEKGLPAPDADTAEYQSFSTDVAGKNGEKRTKLYASYFQKERFYIPNPEYLLATRDDADRNQIFSITNLSQNKLTFIVKKSSDVRNYEITAREWYGKEEIPSFIRPTDLISDYFIEVIAIAGDYGKDRYQSLANDPSFSKFFTEKGLIASQLENFLDKNEVVVKLRMDGCMIPDFRSKSGDSLYIESLVNSNVLSTGVICAVDREQIEGYEYNSNESFLDLIGHRLLDNNVSTISCLSYKQNIMNDFTHTQVIENTKTNFNIDPFVTFTYNPKKITITIDSGYAGFEMMKEKLALGQLFEGETTTQGLANGILITNPVLKISRINKLNNSIVFDLTSPYKDLESKANDLFVDLKKKITVPEVIATGKIKMTNIPVGDTNYIVKINDIDICNTGVRTGGTPEVIAKAIAEDINTGMINSGYVATAATDTVTIKAKTGSGSIGNSLKLSLKLEDENGFDVVNTNSVTQFSGGADGKSSIFVEFVSNKFNLDGTKTYFIADKDSQVYKDWKEGILQNGDHLATKNKTQYMQFRLEDAVKDLDLVNDARQVLKVSLFTDKELEFAIEPGEGIDFGTTIDSQGIENTNAKSLVLVSAIESLSSKFGIIESRDSKTVVADIKLRDSMKVGQYLVGYDSNGLPMLSRIVTVKKITVGESLVSNAVAVECDSDVKIYNTVTGEKQVERYLPFTQIAETLDLYCLTGFALKKSALPDGSNAKMKEIYKVMSETNIGRALIDPELANFRYIIDTFNGGLEPKSKSYLCTLAMERQKCLALLNAPTAKEFKKSSNPRFTTAPTAIDPLPELNVKYIVSGGNVDENPDWLYSLPDEDQGASFAGFFFPNIEVANDDSTVTAIPPSPYVGNAFMRKFGTTDEFKPVAGIIRGIITGEGVTGVDYPLMRDEYSELIEFGINPIITKNGILNIYGNETAYQKFQSTLNDIHARDTLITFEIDTERLLLPYVWDYNDDTLRSTVSTILRNYYDGMKNSYGAIQDYSIVFDRSNNPSWLTEESAALVDVSVEITGCVRKFINRITLKGKSVVSSGFTAI